MYNRRKAFWWGVFEWLHWLSVSVLIIDWKKPVPEIIHGQKLNDAIDRFSDWLYKRVKQYLK